MRRADGGEQILQDVTKQTQILSNKNSKSRRSERSSINGRILGDAERFAMGSTALVAYWIEGTGFFIGLDSISGSVNVMNRLKRHKAYLQFEPGRPTARAT